MPDRKLEGRSAIVTGATQGLGLEIARAFVREGANVLVCARDKRRMEDAQKHLQAFAAPGQKVIAQKANVAKEADVTRLVERAIDEFETLQVLVNNAGIYGPKGPVDDVDWHQWRDTIEINLLGSALTCRHVIPHLRKQRYGKIIQIAGGGAAMPMPGNSAYAASKAAIVRFAETLAEELLEYEIDVNSLSPGALNTRIVDEVLEAGPERVGRSFYERAVKQKMEGGAAIDRGAELCVFLASKESDGITGKLISAVWDPWEELARHRDDLHSDVYSLRRIVPKDRGLPWGNR